MASRARRREDKIIKNCNISQTHTHTHTHIVSIYLSLPNCHNRNKRSRINSHIGFNVFFFAFFYSL